MKQPLELEQALKYFFFFVVIMISLLAIAVVFWGLWRLEKIDNNLLTDTNTPQIKILKEYKNEELGIEITAPEGGALGMQTNDDRYIQIYTKEKDNKGQEVDCDPIISIIENSENLSLEDYAKQDRESDAPFITYKLINQENISVSELRGI